MPSVSKKQERFFKIAAYNPEFAKKVGIDPEFAKHWHEEDKKKAKEKKGKKKASQESLVNIPDFVFLGGTTGGYAWRQEVEGLLEGIDSFNPVVEEWNEETKRLEDHAKDKALFHLYVITPDMSGIYSIAEMTESAIQHPHGTVICFSEKGADSTWTEHQQKSNAAVVELLKKYGATVCTDLGHCATHLNECGALIRTTEADPAYMTALAEEAQSDTDAGDGGE